MQVHESLLESVVESVLESVVIGAGQAGLAASYFLRERGIDHLVLDANPGPGGAWQHRWPSLTMGDVHGVADLPASSAPDGTDRTLVNATGTWTRPFVPHYPGIASFAGEQLHTAGYPGVDHFRGKRVLVVGGGASAVQFIGELAPVTDTLWVTRRPPVWRSDDFDSAAGLAAVTAVEERVRQGLPPASVVSVTGLALRPQEHEAARLGAYERRLPMFERIEPDGVRWADGRFERVDAILWATGFRPAVEHLAPLGLRSPQGGIALVPVRGNVQGATTAVRDPRVQLVGYGPSASTVGASRAGRQAALAVSRQLAAAAA